MTAWAVLNAVGQPSRRLGHTFSYCTTRGAAHVTFGSTDRVTRVSLS